MYKQTKNGFEITRDYLSREDCLTINDNVLSFDYMTPEGPAITNEYERAFNVIFKRESIDKVYEAAPYLEPYFSKVLKEQCNIFYFLVMCLYEGGGIPKHLDGQLPEKFKYFQSFTSPINLPLPYCTSILYTSVPRDMKGGELILYGHPDEDSEFILKPEENLFVEFGDLHHSVNSIATKTDNRPRIAVIVEQYKYLSIQQQYFPDFELAIG